MSGRTNRVVTVGLVLAVSLIASAAAVMLAACYYSRLQFDLLNVVCGEVVEQEPQASGIVSAALKEYTGGHARVEPGYDILSVLGYSAFDLAGPAYRYSVLSALAVFLAGAVILTVTFVYRNRREVMRIRALADYLEQVNTGKAVILSVSGEDDFSKLEDEIYKTVTSLYQTREAAVRAKEHFAENLSNIAHQIKTPITAISLSIQMMRRKFHRDYLEQVDKQLKRLTHLEEALLVLSRIDAGTLHLQKETVDVYTVLVLAADNLQELSVGSGTFIEVPEAGETAVIADMEWTMEAFMNLMKNCMEHNKGGTVHCSYAQNPLYTTIRIWDEGEGFAEDDIPHLFERFYRGQNVCGEGIGIGLALSKEIIERQNGTIQARNMADGGACFEIRFYSH